MEGVAVANGLARGTWIVIMIITPVRNEYEEAAVRGYMKGPHFAYHKGYRKKGTHSWAVTHVDSGMSVGTGMTRTQAMQFAEYCRDHVDPCMVSDAEVRAQLQMKRTEIRGF